MNSRSRLVGKILEYAKDSRLFHILRNVTMPDTIVVDSYSFVL